MLLPEAREYVTDPKVPPSASTAVTYKQKKQTSDLKISFCTLNELKKLFIDVDLSNMSIMAITNCKKSITHALKASLDPFFVVYLSQNMSQAGLLAEKACKANKEVGRIEGDFSRLWEGCQQEIQPGLRRTVTGVAGRL